MPPLTYFLQLNSVASRPPVNKTPEMLVRAESRTPEVCLISMRRRDPRGKQAVTA